MARRARAGSEPRMVVDTTVSWANSDPVNTLKNVVIVNPDILAEDNQYVVYVTNPSTETALDIRVANKILDDVTDRFPTLPGGVFTIPVNTPDGQGSVVDGLFVGLEGRIQLDNTTVIGAGGAFTARVQVWTI